MTKYETVTEFMNDLSDDKKAQVEMLRSVIVRTEPKLEEIIKWNAPNYVFDGEDRITFNMMNKEGVVQLILHMGATRKENKKGRPVLQDSSGLIAWKSDIRGVLSFKDLADVEFQQGAVATIVSNWLKIDLSKA